MSCAGKRWGAVRWWRHHRVSVRRCVRSGRFRPIRAVSPNADACGSAECWMNRRTDSIAIGRPRCSWSNPMTSVPSSASLFSAGPAFCYFKMTINSNWSTKFNDEQSLGCLTNEWWGLWWPVNQQMRKLTCESSSLRLVSLSSESCEKSELSSNSEVSTSLELEAKLPILLPLPFSFCIFFFFFLVGNNNKRWCSVLLPSGCVTVITVNDCSFHEISKPISSMFKASLEQN